jgi:GNAT superfamily N-acetyltransferase
MEGPEGFTVRRAFVADIDTLVSHRREMFRDMGHNSDAALEEMSAKFLPWLLNRMNAGEYIAWLAQAGDGSVAAGAGLWLMDWPPHMIGSGARRGNILNVYTAREFRHRGLARWLTNNAVDWCRENAVDVVILHASDQGRALYQSLGFTPSNEMRIQL